MLAAASEKVSLDIFHNGILWSAGMSISRFKRNWRRHELNELAYSERV
jgi:hypothetical protein